MNLSSDNIKIFPATRRSGEYDPFSRLMSESTITSIINRLVDCDGFVINDELDVFNDSLDNNKPLEFNIFGYYIKIPNIKELLNAFSSATDIYASITLDGEQVPSSTGPSYTQVVGIDENDVYNGVTFSSSEPTVSDTVHALHILTKVGTNWTIPKASVIKFYEIDGGEIVQ